MGRVFAKKRLNWTCVQSNSADQLYVVSPTPLLQLVQMNHAVSNVFALPILSRVITIRNWVEKLKVYSWVSAKIGWEWQQCPLLSPYPLTTFLGGGAQECGCRSEYKLSIFTLYSQYPLLAVLCIWKVFSNGLGAFLKKKAFMRDFRSHFTHLLYIDCPRLINITLKEIKFTKPFSLEFCLQELIYQPLS